MLFYKGEFIKGALKRERVTLDEIMMVARKNGISDLNQVDAIVMETTGDITLIKKINVTDSSIKNVKI